MREPFSSLQNSEEKVYMNTATRHTILNHVDEHILRTLVYYDIFNYPLKAEEVFRFLGTNHVDESFITERLNDLRDQHLIFQFENFFSLKNNIDPIVRRKKGNVEAERYLLLAEKKALLISKFPFVRAVMASGSLSKGYMDEKSDLDFFIVTAPNRLWIARTLLVMYKRLFLFNSHKYFCVNYFVDEKHLEIEEKNLFTATELATVIPLYGSKQYENLHRVNAWLKEFFPNYTPRSIANVPATTFSWGKRIVEKFLNLFFGNVLEKYFQKKTLDRWRKQYEKNYSAADFKVAFKSKSYASKNHPRNFQRSVMEVYSEKLKSFGINTNPSQEDNAQNSFPKYEPLKTNFTV
jgi:hypothetical protein